MGRITLSLLDKSRESASIGFPVPDLGAANIATYTDTGVGQALGDLRNAALALTLLTETGRTVTAEATKEAAPTPPTEDYAQREIALVFFMADTGGHKSRVSVPGADLTGVAQSGTDDVPLSGITVVENMISAIESYCVDPVTGNAVTVYNVRIIGRGN